MLSPWRSWRRGRTDTESFLTSRWSFSVLAGARRATTLLTTQDSTQNRKTISPVSGRLFVILNIYITIFFQNTNFFRKTVQFSFMNENTTRVLQQFLKLRVFQGRHEPLFRGIDPSPLLARHCHNFFSFAGGFTSSRLSSLALSSVLCLLK